MMLCRPLLVLLAGAGGALSCQTSDKAEFVGASPGPILPVATAVAQGKVDADLTCGLLAIEPGRDRWMANGVPFSTIERHYLRTFTAKEKGKTLIALPYAIDERYRNVTLHIGRDQFLLRLPVTHELGPSLRKPVGSQAGPFKVTASFAPWRYSTEPFRINLSVDKKDHGPRLVFHAWTPETPAGKAVEDVRMFEGDATVEVTTSQANPADRLQVSVLELEPVPIRLRAKKSTAPTEYFLPNGKKLYNRYHKLLEESGFVVVKVRNIYLSNYGIRNRPPGNAPSYAAIRDGEVFDAVGYRLKSKSRATTTLAFDLPSIGSGSMWRASAFISPRSPE